MYVGSMSTHTREEEEESVAADLNSEEAAIGVVEEAAEDYAKEIQIKVKRRLK